MYINVVVRNNGKPSEFEANAWEVCSSLMMRTVYVLLGTCFRYVLQAAKRVVIVIKMVWNAEFESCVMGILYWDFTIEGRKIVIQLYDVWSAVILLFDRKY